MSISLYNIIQNKMQTYIFKKNKFIFHIFLAHVLRHGKFICIIPFDKKETQSAVNKTTQGNIPM